MFRSAWITLFIVAFQSLWGATGGNFIYTETIKPLPAMPAFKKARRDESTEFHAWAALGARGGFSKQGVPARDAFARKFAVTPEHIHAFDAYVSELAGMMNDHNGDTAA